MDTTNQILLLNAAANAPCTGDCSIDMIGSLVVLAAVLATLCWTIWRS